ncbi:DUF1963 domain-containing protein [Chitinophaga pendula]|uniref:DUF1963 domain-containing protein n=1 Tax=Chitinophaga TaxID=79328 RepID=UPI000BAF8714|nr:MULTISPECIES: DUF1963 domain-containing protein [Chitinophaga]ASZ10729.1 hypothetical protein CK934_06925 [Chitinophaga sp. MD30]UCJ06294.1 DUF1963 domain-containing protein [Chitinophaga pendula]
MSQIDQSSQQQLLDLLTPLIKEATRIIPHPPLRMPASSHLTSHFGGTPYFEQGEAWPVTEKGTPLAFIFQIINDGQISLPESIKVLQFYYDWENGPWDTPEDGWLVKTYRQIDPQAPSIAEKPYTRRLVKFCNITFEQVKSLPDWEGISHWNKNAEAIAGTINEAEPWEAYDEAVKQLIGEQSYRSQLGGYPKWLQAAADPANTAGHPMPLLFQLDSESHPGLNWGDSGLVYVFLDENNTEFTLQSL